ncbi:MAG: hypothetical protein WDW36_007657 [Sanguina aurantia]
MQPHMRDDYPHALDDDWYEQHRHLLESQNHTENVQDWQLPGGDTGTDSSIGGGRTLTAQRHASSEDGEDAASRKAKQIAKRCRLTRGGEWCARYKRQAEIPTKPVPRGDMECPSNCNGNGNCNYDSGICECPAGWSGNDCGTPLLRPCTHKWRESGNVTMGHIDAEGRDLDIMERGWTASRCSGICDATVASCFCDGKFKRIFAPKGSNYRVQPVQPGRTLGDHCMLKTNKEGKPTELGQIPWEKLYGPRGWCEARDNTLESCGCGHDGWSGHTCENAYEQTCVNQCAGHGTCIAGFCMCHAGWYGTDCTRKRAGSEMEEGDFESKPWLKETVGIPPAAAAVPAAPTRKRPLIYIYDMPPEFTTRMHQYRISGNACVYRRYNDQNKSMLVGGGGYGTEMYLYETLLQSEHRTFDPEEADFFYIPTFLSCWLSPVFGWADFPWYNGPITNRPYQGANFIEKAKRWVQTTHPYWDRRNGRDHIWFAVHDEGACWWPKEAYDNSIVLTHWGRLDVHHQPAQPATPPQLQLRLPQHRRVRIPIAAAITHTHDTCEARATRGTLSSPQSPHQVSPQSLLHMPSFHVFSSCPVDPRTPAADAVGWVFLTPAPNLPPRRSNSAYFYDNYTKPMHHKEWAPGDWRDLIKGHVCFDPHKDLVIPMWKMPGHFRTSPLVGAAPRERKFLLSFIGDMGTHRFPYYSRGIRQTLYTKGKEHKWREKYNIILGYPHEVDMSYSDALSQSTFCLVAPGPSLLPAMNRHGVLAAILPAFGKVFGRMQYDLFHVYTVDEHTLRVLRNVARFAQPSAKAEFPVACPIWSVLPKPEILLLAALFHDIAKGRGGDHSVLGEDDARTFCNQLGLPRADVERVAWLVRHHLLMSTTAQRQDITDPDVVQRFSDLVEDRERLGQLYLLTIADIIGTSPRLWNAWKDRLLSDLYTATRYALRSDVNLPRDASERVTECSEHALALLMNEGYLEPDVLRVWAGFPQLSFLRHRPEQIAWQTSAILDAKGAVPLVIVQPFSVRGCTELFVYTPDRDGLFATVTAVLDRLRFSVMESRILSASTGMALDTFLLLEADTQQPAVAERALELQQRLQCELEKSTGVQPSKRNMTRHQKHFQTPPRISFHAAGDRTQLALVGTDRPGLLAAVAQVMLSTHTRVHDARIATFGERVEDFFQLTDRHNVALDAPQQAALLEALMESIGPSRD